MNIIRKIDSFLGRNRHIVLERSSLRVAGTIIGSPQFWSRVFISLLFIIVCLILILITLSSSLHATKQKNRQVQENTIFMRDSLQNILDSYKIELEESNIHALIGQFTLSKKNNSCTRENLRELLDSINVWYPEYIIAQAILESGCGRTSPEGSNNLFGMRVPGSRETTALNIGSKEYARYLNWELSVLDRVLWELYAFGHKRPTRDEYLNKLKTYAEDDKYIEKIRKISSTL